MPENQKNTNSAIDESTNYLAYPTLMPLPRQEKTTWQRVEELEAKVQRLLAEAQDCAAEVQRLKAELRTDQPEPPQPAEGEARRLLEAACALQGLQSRREKQPGRKRLGVLKNYSDVDSNGLNRDTLSFDRVTPKENIRVIQFLNTLADAPKDAADCSEAQDGSVLCWTVGSVQYIAGEGGVNTGSSCAYLFSDYTRMTAIRFAGHFDTSQATNMSQMFFGCSALAALDLSGFDTSNVTDMSGMFGYCKVLMRVNVSGWDTASVTDMNHMFADCASLPKLDLSGWETASVTAMNHMFADCAFLSKLDLSGWNTSNVKNMGLMFYGCTALTTLDLTGWNTANVTEMYAMFSGCTALTEFDPAWLDTSAAYTEDMYAGTRWENVRKRLGVLKKSGDELSFDGVTPKSSIRVIRFRNTLADAPKDAADCSEAQDGSVLCWTVGPVQYIAGEGGVAGGNSCAYLFSGYEHVSAIYFAGSFDTSNVTDMSHMFCSCKALSALDLSAFDTSQVTNMTWMFGYCASLRTLNLSGWDTSRVTNLDHMFYNCKVLQALNLSGWNTSRVTNMKWMFGFCQSLTKFDPAWLDTSHADTSGMYAGARWK